MVPASFYPAHQHQMFTSFFCWNLFLFCFVLVSTSPWNFTNGEVEINRRLFGSKTPYNTSVYTDWERIIREEASLSPSCKLFHIRMVARHGTRSPDAKNIEGVKKALRRIQEASVTYATLGTKEQQGLRNLTLLWKNTLPEGKRLMERGLFESAFLARDFYDLIAKHTSILKNRFAFYFHSTEIARSYDSGRAFREEFVKLINASNFTPPSYNIGNVTKNDDILYFHKNCPAFSVNVDRSNITSAETKSVRLTPEAISLVNKINKQRLGFPENTIEWNNVFALYQMAAFESATYNSSIFLQLFDDADLEFLEYADELDNYWKKAYGHPLIADLSCVLTNNIFDTAQRKIAYPSREYDAIFEFAHLETLLPVYAAFGLFHDRKQDFVANAPRSFISHRQFKMSEIGPFAANIAFLFFACPDYEEAYKTEYRVIFTVNGKAVPLVNVCPTELSCPLQLARSASGTDPTFNCNLKELCALESGKLFAGMLGDANKTSAGASEMPFYFPERLLLLLLHLILTLLTSL